MESFLREFPFENKLAQIGVMGPRYLLADGFIGVPVETAIGSVLRSQGGVAVTDSLARTELAAALQVDVEVVPWQVDRYLTVCRNNDTMEAGII